MYHNQYNKAILFRVVASEVVLKACSAQIWVNLKESIKNGVQMMITKLTFISDRTKKTLEEIFHLPSGKTY